MWTQHFKIDGSHGLVLQTVLTVDVDEELQSCTLVK